MTRICPIVEGHGEVAAVPVLIRLVQGACGQFDATIHKPIRIRRGSMTDTATMRRRMEYAVSEGATSFLILLDADEDCPVELADAIRAELPPIPDGVSVEVCVAKREYEAWLLASLDSVRHHQAINPGCDPFPDPESAGGAKAQIGRRMKTGRYIETLHQPRLTAAIDVDVAARNSRSFRHFLAACRRLLGAPA